jgi:hypothetical protein
MANCPNCGAALSCGCQRKTASDGKQGCVQCIPAYEQKLKQQSKKMPGGNPPGNRGQSGNSGYSFSGGNIIMN